jgi:parallel beta-helix repeat protein
MFRKRKLRPRRRLRATRPWIEQLEDRQLLSTFAVTTVNDNGDNSNATAGSLRKAILDANAAPPPMFGVNRIAFNIFSIFGGVQTIRPPAALPIIAKPVFIDGSTQPGFSGKPLIELDGSNAGSGVNGLTINAGESIPLVGHSGVNALAINRFSGDGIFLNMTGNNTITNCFIGTDATGTTALPNGLDGIGVRSQNNLIGGTTAADRNVISGNTGNGIDFFGTPLLGTIGSNNAVEGNYIGTNAAGTGALANGGAGIFVNAFATDETIGTAASGAGNVISGNSGAGISIASGSNTVQGNLIGTNAAGTGPLGNAHGIDISSSGNTIGGNFAPFGSGPANVISGNVFSGVEIFGGVSNNKVQGNFIGTDAAGDAAVGNGRNGVLITDSTNNLIGGTAHLSPGLGQPGQTNIISGNVANGVQIFSSTPGAASTNTVQGNLIGVDINADIAIPNGTDGVLISSSANNLIGGSRTITGGPFDNYISGNLGAGVHITGSGATGNMVQGNIIGVNQNASASLANHLDGILIESPSNTVGGPTADTLNLVSGNGRYGINLNGNSATTNIIEHNFIGTDVRPSWTNPNPEGDAANPNALEGVAIIAQGGPVTTTDQILDNTISGNTQGGLLISSGGSNTVQGNVIGINSTGFHPLPNGGPGISIVGGANNLIGGTTTAARNFIASNAGAGVTLAGPSATGNIVAGNYIGIAQMIAGGNGGGIFVQGASGNTIGGTAAGASNVISANVGDGIDLEDVGGNAVHNVIQGNFIGTDPAGSTASGFGNTGSGIFVLASSNTIGGAAPGAGNVVSGNSSNGVWLDGDGNLVQGNMIGTDKNGTAALANASVGVRVTGGQNNPIVGNVISGNALHGALLESSASGNVLENNLIGTDVTGSVALGNTMDGVRVDSATGNSILDNLISGNGGNGVGIGVFQPGGAPADNNLVQGNTIGLNASGAGAIPNRLSGVLIFESSHNVVGGTGFRAGNLISANGGDGVHITTLSNTATGNVVQGDMIGTDATGTHDLGNLIRGVFVEGASNTVIGGSTSPARNIISGNATFGVVLTNGATASLVQGNYVGTDITGTKGLGNSFDGVLLDNAPGNTVGGTTVGAGNLISGNVRYGVHFLDTDAHDNVLQGNLIGTQADGHSPLGNGSDGVFFVDGSSNNLIGGMDPAAGNTIAFNGGNGVTVGPTANDMSTGDAILSNSIFSNGKLGIDLADDGVTANHSMSPTPGPNNFQNFPVITSVMFDSALTTTTIRGTLASTASSTFTVQLFASPSANSSGFGEGKTLIGTTNVMTDVSGNASFSLMIMPLIQIGQRITATATLMTGTPPVPRDTSEFSRAVPVGTPTQRFVAQAYQDILQREVDSTGLNEFSSFLDQGGARSAVPTALLASAEYRGLVVEGIYHTYLHRDPEPASLAGFVTFLGNGGTDEQVESFIVRSPEYFQVRGGGTNRGFINALYMDALHRPADPNALASFDVFLTVQGGTRAQVADLIFASPEYKGVLVAGYYEQFMRRMADSAGLNAFVGFLQQSGTRDEQVIAALVASDEYFMLV